MLAGEDLGRGHHRGLAAGLDGGEHGEERDQRLAGADVALEEAVHPGRGGHVGGDLGDGAGLGVGRARRGARRGRGPAGAPSPRVDEALGALHLRAGDGERHLVGEELVVGEPLARGGGGGEVGGARGGVGGGERGAEGGPAALAEDARLDPLGEVGDAGERVLRRRGSWCGASRPWVSG